MRRWIGICLVAFALVPAQAAGYTTTQLDSTAPENRMIGRLFVTRAAVTVRCSAAVVDAPNRSTILTAGHCLNSATGGPAVSMRFVPGYHDGVAPYGEWNSLHSIPSPHWNTVHFGYDYGFIVAARNAQGVAVEDAVGALPIAFNQPRVQDYRLLGLPSEAPYDGQKLWACNTTWLEDITSDAGPGPYRLRTSCDSGPGASGGPWLGASGAVASVVSTRSVSDPTHQNGPYLDGEAAALYGTAGNTPTTPAPVFKKKKKCKKKKKGHKRALAAKKKCKKKHK